MKFSLLTYNIWSGKLHNEVIQFLQEKDADVICLQEVGVFSTYHAESEALDMRAELQRALPDYHMVYAPICKRMRGGTEESFGNAILSKFPIHKSEVHYLVHPLNWTDKHEEQSRNILEVELLIKEKKITIITGHLTYAPQFEDTDTQLKEVEEILRIIKDRSPLIFAGDYNSHADTLVYKKLSKELSVTDEQKAPTFAKHPFSYNGFDVKSLEYKIDHILGTEDVCLSKAQVIDVPYSDHLPILADIEF